MCCALRYLFQMRSIKRHYFYYFKLHFAECIWNCLHIWNKFRRALNIEKKEIIAKCTTNGIRRHYFYYFKLQMLKSAIFCVVLDVSLSISESLFLLLVNNIGSFKCNFVHFECPDVQMFEYFKITSWITVDKWYTYGQPKELVSFHPCRLLYIKFFLLWNYNLYLYYIYISAFIYFIVSLHCSPIFLPN